MPETENEKNAMKRQPDFVAELTPYRSLGQKGFIILMAFVSITCFAAGMMFLIAGAWPVMFFMGLDVLVIWLAFKVNYHSAKVKEIISIGRDHLKVEKTDPWGRTTEHIFNPFWSRFEINRHEELGITEMVITQRNRRLRLGEFLNPDDKESFAAAFSNALARAKAA